MVGKYIPQALGTFPVDFRIILQQGAIGYFIDMLQALAYGDEQHADRIEIFHAFRRIGEIGHRIDRRKSPQHFPDGFGRLKTRDTSLSFILGVVPACAV